LVALYPIGKIGWAGTENTTELPVEVVMCTSVVVEDTSVTVTVGSWTAGLVTPSTLAFLGWYVFDPFGLAVEHLEEGV
jgi:hypothetical protein